MKSVILLTILFLPGWALSQQISDTTYNPAIKNPAYELGKGPVVFIDEGHHNFHTLEGRYQPFAHLLERDGYKVLSYSGEFRNVELSKGKILVIANALNELNVSNWYLPNPSAFSVEEIEIIRQWVFAGGSLFLIADHMPMAGAAIDLANAFDFTFTNGFARNMKSQGPDIFSIKDKTLTESILTKGRDASESVQQITSFAGQAFKMPADASPILTFGKNYENLLPDTAWVFNETTTKYSVEGWSQGAFKTFGKGRIVVFGEAAMFTAQLAGPNRFKVGMNSDVAPQNYRLLLNIVHWLDGILE